MNSQKAITLFIQWVMLCLLVTCREDSQLMPVTPSLPNLIVQSTTTLHPMDLPIASLTPLPIITPLTPLTTPTFPVPQTTVHNALSPAERPLEDVVIDTSTPTLQFLPTSTPTATPEIFPTFVFTQEFSIYEALQHLYAGEGVFFSDDFGAASFVAIPDEGTSLELSPCIDIFYSSKKEKPLANYDCVTVILAEPFQQASVEKFLLLTQTTFSEGHSAAPYINGAIFSRIAGNWQLDFYQAGFFIRGSFGQAPTAYLVQISPERHGVLFEDRGASAGLGWHGLTLVVDFSNQFEILYDEILGLTSYEENWSFEASWFFVPAENPEWFDLQVTLQGTRPKPQTQQIEQFVETRLYRWDGQHYALLPDS